MKNRLHSSFRDPSGFLFTRDGILYRQVNKIYSDDYSTLMESGLYEKLVKVNLLLSHDETKEEPAIPDIASKILRPKFLPFISYPYEWSFSQLKDAAKATLAIQKRALKAGMSLKDASAYNIQFVRGKPTLIDTLSFERYKEGEPWIAYRQFCQHFLAPLALISYCDIRLNLFSRLFIDGIPLDLASKLLPGRSRWNIGIFTHIHLHAKAQQHYAQMPINKARAGRKMSKTSLLGLIDSLEQTIQKLEWKPLGTEWADYYRNTNYSDSALEHKQTIIAEWLENIHPRSILDLGANTGRFSRIASTTSEVVIACDIDPAAVEINYLTVKSNKEGNLYPLVIDLTNPSPAQGWGERERDAFTKRGQSDLVMALALVHHLAISNNVPMDGIVDYFSELGDWLIVEFIPKSDSQVQKLLSSRQDIFQNYNIEGFKDAFTRKYEIQQSVQVKQSERWLFLMKTRK